MSDKRRVALLIIGDGRDRLREQTLRSFEGNCAGPVIPRFVIEVDDRQHRLGFTGAIREGWAKLRSIGAGFDYVFHLEEDWSFDRPFRLDRMLDLLECDPRLAQVALRRGPVNPAEDAAGGVVECWPGEYEDGTLHVPLEEPCAFLRHRLFWTTNPSVYSRRLIEELDWPDVPGSERSFTNLVLSTDRAFAYWGSREDGAWITHTGERARGAKGY